MVLALASLERFGARPARTRIFLLRLGISGKSSS
jgi:hypothetical protein